MNLSWRTKAACHGLDPQVFYPETDEEAMPAKQVCSMCPVQGACLEYALARRDQGGLLWLGPWLAYSTEPLLSWSAVERAEGWVVQSVSLD